MDMAAKKKMGKLKGNRSKKKLNAKESKQLMEEAEGRKKKKSIIEIL